MSFASLVSWTLPVAVTLIGSLLGLLKFLTEHQEKAAAGLRADIEALRDEMNENDDQNRTAIETCKSEHYQVAANLRLLIAEQREKIAEHRVDAAEHLINKEDFRDFVARLEERLSRMERKIDHLGSTPRTGC